MSIILFTNSLDFGGASTFFIRMNDAFNNEDIKSYIVSFNNERDGKQENILNLNIFKRIKLLNKKIKEYNCTTIITNYGLETLVAKLATVFLHKEVKIISVVHIRSIMFIPEDMNNVKQLIFKLLIKLSFKLCDKCVAVSNDLRDELIKEKWVKERNIVTICNPIIDDNFNFQCKKLELNQSINIGIIGWIWDIKNQEDGVRALKILNNKKFKLHIIGGIKDSKYYDELKKIIIDLNLSDSIIFHGLKENVFEELKKIDILILTSKTEALPTVIVEALACGVPVIARNCKVGPKEILKNSEYGYLYEEFDISNLAKSIKEITDNPELYNKLSYKGIIRAKDFTYRKAVLNYKNLIGKLK